MTEKEEARMCGPIVRVRSICGRSIASPGTSGFSRTAVRRALGARADGPRSVLFFHAGRLPDGTLNGIYIQRLKDKLGNRSNASSEVEFIDAWAYLMGEEGRGIPPSWKWAPTAP